MSWRKVKLGELVDNFSVRAKDVGGADGLEFFGVSNEVGITKTKYAAEEKAEDYKIIEQYCFAYNPYRVNVGSIGMVTENIKGLISPAYVVFKPKPNSIKAELLLKFLKSSEGLRQIKFYARGTVRQALRFEDLCNIELSLPDFDEQENLIEKLNSVQIEGDELNTELTHQQDLLKQLSQSFLREAIQGKLVKQDKKEGNASDLLKKIKSEKEKLIKAKQLPRQKALPEISEEEISFDVPDNWVWCRLGDVVTQIFDGPFGSHLKTADYTGSGIQVIRLQNLGVMKFKDEKETFVNQEKYESIIQHTVYEGDVLIGSFLADGVNCVVLPKLKHTAIAKADCFTIRIKHDMLLNNFVMYLLSSDLMFVELSKLLRGMTRLRINTTQLKQLPIPLPPLGEQKRIVKKLEEVMNLCEELKTTITDNQNYTNQLLQVALKDALQPKQAAKIISLPVKQEAEKDYFVKRKVLATYIINQSLNDAKFGDTKFEKELHLAEYFAIKRNLNQNYLQKAAGPYDNKFTYAYFQQVEKSKWFIRKKQGAQFVFKAGQSHAKSTNTYNYFSKEELEKVNEIISYFKNYDYEQPEIVSTLYAVWNNRIIQQQEITDNLLMQDFYNWDEQKKKYKQDRLGKALQWMRTQKFIPDGWGKLIVKAK